MKRLFLFVFSLVLAVLSYAQVPVKPNQPYVKTVDANTYFSTKVGSDTTYLKVSDAVNGTDYFYTKQQVQALPTQPSFEQALIALGTTAKAFPVTVNIGNLFSGTSALTSGAAYFVYFNVTDTISSTGVRWIQRNAFVGTGDAYNGFGLYSVSAGTYTFITQTVTDNDLWKVTDFATGTKAWPTPQTLLPGKYMVAILWHASSTSTAPTIYSHGPISANHSVFLTNSNKISSYISSQTSLPNPTTTGSATTVNNVLWGIWLY